MQVSNRLVQGWHKPDLIDVHTDNYTMYNYTFNNLMSRTEYAVRISVTYRSMERLYWPQDHRLSFKTAGLLQHT